MDWRKHVSTLSTDVEFRPPARPAQIRDAESKLGVVFPKELKELLRQSNGLIDCCGGTFVWSTDEIVKRNLEMRTYRAFRKLYMPFDPLLFFGDEGNGDLYFFAILDGKIRDPAVFRWDHENDSRTDEHLCLQAYVDDFVNSLVEPDKTA
jgi:SMI1-KNR4 cell-wall